MMERDTLRFQLGGALRPGKLYVERSADRELLDAIRRGQHCLILAPRQSGKSSLRVHMEEHLREPESGVRCATVDLAGHQTLEVKPEEWYYGLAEDIHAKLGLQDDPATLWERHAGADPVYRWRRYLQDVVLVRIAERVVIFVDEIDKVLNLSFGNGFFDAIGACRDAAAQEPAYARLTFCLIGVIAPDDLTRDERRSSLNLDHWIRPEDFTRREVEAFQRELPGTDAETLALMNAIFRWTEGHPYMTQCVCEALAQEEEKTGEPAAERVEGVVKELFVSGGRAKLLFSEAERRLVAHPRAADLIRLYGRLLSQEAVPLDPSNPVHLALQLSGMAAARGEGADRQLCVRNPIFAAVFDSSWVRRQEERRSLADRVRRWRESGRKPDFVQRGEELREAIQWAEGRDDVTTEERDFLIAGQQVAQEEARAHSQAELRRQELEQAEERTRLQRWAIKGLSALALLLILAVAVAWWQAVVAQKATVLAQKSRDNEEAAKNTAVGARRIAERATSVAEAEAQNRLHQQQRAEKAEKRASTNADAARRERDRAKEALGREQTALRESLRHELEALGTTAKLQTRQPGLEAQALDIALRTVRKGLSRRQPLPPVAIDGLATAVAHAMSLEPLGKRPSPRPRAAFLSSDGRLALTTGAHGTSELWDVETNSSLGSLPEGSGPTPAFAHSRSGVWIVAVACGDRTQLWQVRPGASRAIQPGRVVGYGATATGSGRSGISLIALSPEGTHLITVGKDGSAVIVIAGGKEDVSAPKYSLRKVPLHLGKVSAVEFSPDGQRLLSIRDDGRAELWEITPTPRSRLLPEVIQKIAIAHFSPDGRSIVTATDPGDPPATPSDRGRFRLGGYLSAPGSSGTSPSIVRLWRLGARRRGFDLAALDSAVSDLAVVPWRVLQGHTDRIRSVAFSPLGEIVTAAADGVARLWDNEGQPLFTLEDPSGDVTTAAFSASGQWVVTGGKDGAARLWRRSGQLVGTQWADTEGIRHARFSPDQDRVVTIGADQAVRLWNLHPDLSLGTLRNRSRASRSGGRVLDAAFDETGSHLLTASTDDRGRGKLESWNLTHERPPEITRLGKVGSATFSGDGSYLVTASDEMPDLDFLPYLQGQTNLLPETSVWILSGGRPHQLTTLPDARRSRYFLDRGFLVTVTEEGIVRLWDLRRVRRIRRTAQFRIGTGRLHSVVCSPDGSRVATISHLDRSHGTYGAGVGQRELCDLWDTRGGKRLAQLYDDEGMIQFAAFSPDGRFVITGGRDKKARLWRAHDGTLARTLRGHTGAVTFASFSRDGTRVLTGSADKTARLWRVAAGTPARDPYVLREHEAPLQTGSFSRDGTRVLTASVDGTAQLWSAESGQRVLACVGHAEAIRTAVLSPDGSFVAAVSTDGIVKLFSTRVETYLKMARELIAIRGWGSVAARARDRRRWPHGPKPGA